MAVRARHGDQAQVTLHLHALRMVMAVLALAALVAACASGPVPPEWQTSAKGALDRATAAYLAGDARAEADEFERARSAIARTGRGELLARAELMRCAARVASLVLEPCERFEALRADAAAPEIAYAEYLAVHKLAAVDIARLPPAQQPAAAAIAAGQPAPASVASIDDPLSRLIALAVLFQAGQASPAMMALAADTASLQGWRRPLLAWLKVHALRAERAGDAAEAQRLQRRIAIVQDAR